ncbi:unnamed protein product [Arctogadus glacialis]
MLLPDKLPLFDTRLNNAVTRQTTTAGYQTLRCNQCGLFSRAVAEACWRTGLVNDVPSGGGHCIWRKTMILPANEPYCC